MKKLFGHIKNIKIDKITLRDYLLILLGSIL